MRIEVLPVVPFYLALSAGLVCGLWSHPSSAQSFLNGSFENNELDTCAINVSNDYFTNLLEHTAAFGEKNEMDILTESCGYGSAADGSFFVALSGVGSSDALSLELTVPFKQGHKYAFRFYSKAGNANAHFSGLSIGLSDQPDQFGFPIYSTESIEDEWLPHDVIFTAPVDGEFITVKLLKLDFSWIYLDNFHISCPEAITLGNDTAYCKVENIHLELPDQYDTYTWQDGSTAATYQVNTPGLYAVEVTTNQCVLRDTILIGEIPFNCDCHIYLPNAFSPNGDGINDLLVPFSLCPFILFEWKIFDRWGRLVFQSFDPALAWDGSWKGKTLSAGVYFSFIQFQYAHQTEPQLISGEINKL